MINLLERFKENEIQNKDDLLYSLGSMYDNFDSDSSVSSVKLASVCPSKPAKVLASTPPCIACVAKVWRKSWKRISGSSARLSILLSLSYAAVGFNGRAGFSKFGNTH